MAESLMEKERHRWSYMTENQLTTRLKRITNPEKLRCFMDLADDNGNRLLYHLAVERAKDLRIHHLMILEPSPYYQKTCGMPLKKKKIKKVNTGSKKKVEDNIRTILI